MTTLKDVPEVIHTFERRLQQRTGNLTLSLRLDGTSLVLRINTKNGEFFWVETWIPKKMLLGSCLDKLRSQMERDLIRIACR